MLPHWKFWQIVSWLISLNIDMDGVLALRNDLLFWDIGVSSPAPHHSLREIVYFLWIENRKGYRARLVRHKNYQ